MSIIDFTRPYLERDANGIDAAVFSGDAFFEADNRAALRWYCASWLKELDTYEQPDQNPGER